MIEAARGMVATFHPPARPTDLSRRKPASCSRYSGATPRPMPRLPPAAAGIALPYQADAFKREIRIDVLDAAGLRRDHRRQPSGGNDGSPCAELSHDPVDESFDQPHVAKERPRLHAGGGIAADDTIRALDGNAVQARRAGDQRLDGGPDSGRDHAADEGATSRDDVEVGRGAKVDD